MATVGASDYTMTNIVLNADGSITYTSTPTGWPPGVAVPTVDTETPSMVNTMVDCMVDMVVNMKYWTIYTPLSTISADIAISRGLITAAQFETWLAGADNLKVGGMPGYTSYDYDGTSPVPTPATIAENHTGINTSDPTTAVVTQPVIDALTDDTVPTETLPTLTAHQLEMTQLYLAAFLRAPEHGGVDYWTDTHLDQGMSLHDVGNIIFSLDIVKAIYPESMTDSGFLTAIYHNVFGKTPDSGGLAYWLNEMTATGASRGDMVMTMINAGMHTAVGTPGREYIMNRYEAAQYAVQKQIKADVSLPVDYLLNMHTHVNATDSTVNIYDQSIFDSMGTPNNPVNHFSVGLVGQAIEAVV